MPSLGEIAQMILALAMLFNTWQSWRNGRKIEQVHIATNSLTDRLVAKTAAASLAEGTALGLEQGRQETISRSS
jgi:LPS sulfotransferase NodH